MATIRENLISDTVWELCNKLTQQARTGQSVCVEFKEFSVVYTMYPNAIVLRYEKGHQELHETKFCDNANMNHLFIRDEIVKNTLMLYIKNALETLSDKEIEEVFESHFGVKA